VAAKAETETVVVVVVAPAARPMVVVGAGEPARPAECPAVADHPHLACPDTAKLPNSLA